MQVRKYLELATLVSGMQLNECDFFFDLPTLINDIVIRRNATRTIRRKYFYSSLQSHRLKHDTTLYTFNNTLLKFTSSNKQSSAAVNQ